jgi:hypothetical protein
MGAMKAKKKTRKKTEKSVTAKKTTKEGDKEKRTKDTRKKANEEVMRKQKAKEEALKNEALDFYRQLRERGLKPFDGASIDFHRKRDPVVFIPKETPLITAVKKEELLNFLMANDIRRVLIDALFPSRVPIIAELLQHGIEVYVLMRPMALAGFKAMLERRYNKQKQDGNNNDNNGIKIPRKNDFVDAVALAFTWPKFHRRLDWRFLECWRAMNKWRRAYTIYTKVQQMIEDLENDEIPATLHEDRVIEKAREFVDTVERHFPDIKQVFEEIRIPDDDVIAQALCAEIVLETYHIERRVSDVLRKAGIGRPSKRRERKEAKENESKGEPENKRKTKKKSFQYDGKLLFAINQLTIKMYHLNPKKDQKRIKWKAPKLLKRVWRCSRELQMMKESGRVGEALGCPRPLEKRGFHDLRPAHMGWAPCESRGAV